MANPLPQKQKSELNGWFAAELGAFLPCRQLSSQKNEVQSWVVPHQLGRTIDGDGDETLDFRCAWAAIERRGPPEIMTR